MKTGEDLIVAADKSESTIATDLLGCRFGVNQRRETDARDIRCMKVLDIGCNDRAQWPKPFITVMCIEECCEALFSPWLPLQAAQSAFHFFEQIAFLLQAYLWREEMLHGDFDDSCAGLIDEPPCFGR